MSAAKVLVIDDESFNLEIIAEFLEAPEFAMHAYESADAAWAHLQNDGATYDLILLDRMMPGMDGIEFLRRIKADPRFQRVPVIMQTAAASPDEVNEGVAAGAYYYLAKPYAASALLAIVRAALHESSRRTRLEAPHPAIVPDQEGAFSFRTPHEAVALAMQLAQHCPLPQLAVIGLTELLLNAIEHGNLALSYADKKRHRLDGSWELEVERRLAAAEYAEHHARVEVVPGENELTFVVTDRGQGFDWQQYVEIAPERAYDPNGRGIAMARQLSFKRLVYKGCGNIAVAVVSLEETND